MNSNRLATQWFNVVRHLVQQRPGRLHLNKNPFSIFSSRSDFLKLDLTMILNIQID
jgi:hypothetical protein